MIYIIEYVSYDNDHMIPIYISVYRGLSGHTVQRHHAPYTSLHALLTDLACLKLGFVCVHGHVYLYLFHANVHMCGHVRPAGAGSCWCGSRWGLSASLSGCMHHPTRRCRSWRECWCLPAGEDWTHRSQCTIYWMSELLGALATMGMSADLQWVNT